MKIKNGIFMMIASLALFQSHQSQAIVYPDQVVASDDENENEDSISRFGGAQGSGQNRKKNLTGNLSPIQESSFAASAGRAPASVRTVTGENTKTALMRKLKKEKAYQEVAVIANELGFFPSTVFVTEGVSVRLFVTGASEKSQCFMLDSFGVRRQIRSQKIEEITFTPSESGKFTFHCPMNGAKGTLVVRELDLGERSPASASN